MAKHREPCNCSAYGFPHRPHGGDCGKQVKTNPRVEIPGWLLAIGAAGAGYLAYQGGYLSGLGLTPSGGGINLFGSKGSGSTSTSGSTGTAGNTVVNGGQICPPCTQASPPCALPCFTPKLPNSTVYG